MIVATGSAIWVEGSCCALDVQCTVRNTPVQVVKHMNPCGGMAGLISWVRFLVICTHHDAFRSLKVLAIVGHRHSMKTDEPC
jgi:hypothetical protein